MITVKPASEPTILDLIYTKSEILVKEAEIRLEHVKANLSPVIVSTVCIPIRALATGEVIKQNPYVTVADCMECITQSIYVFIEHFFQNMIDIYLEREDFEKMVKSNKMFYDCIHFFNGHHKAFIKKGEIFQISLKYSHVAHLRSEEKEWLWLGFTAKSDPEMIFGNLTLDYVLTDSTAFQHDEWDLSLLKS